MKQSDKLEVEHIIRELIAEDAHITNAEIAQITSKRLGLAISAKSISKIRNDIGMGAYQLAESELMERFRKMLQSDRDNELQKLFSPLQASLHSHDIEYQLQELALSITLNCVRNTVIEDYHAGSGLSSMTGDYPDVSADMPNDEIICENLSRINDAEMKAFNIEVTNKIYTVLQFLLNPAFADKRDAFLRLLSQMHPIDWNKPVLDTDFVRALAIFENRMERNDTQ